MSGRCPPGRCLDPKECPLWDDCEGEPLVVNPTIDIKTVAEADTDNPDEPGEPLGGFMRVTAAGLQVTVLVSFPTVAAMTAALAKVLEEKARWDRRQEALEDAEEGEG